MYVAVPLKTVGPGPVKVTDVPVAVSLRSPAICNEAPLVTLTVRFPAIWIGAEIVLLPPRTEIKAPAVVPRVNVPQLPCAKV